MKTTVIATFTALVLAPGAAGATKPLPPIDAGSSVPNPVYAAKAGLLPPIDAGSDVPNPAYLVGSPAAGAADVGAIPLESASPRTADYGAFDWRDAGIGAGTTGILLALSAATALAVRRTRPA